MLVTEKLSHELLEVFHSQSPGMERKHDIYQMAEPVPHTTPGAAHISWGCRGVGGCRRSPGLSAARNKVNRCSMEST